MRLLYITDNPIMGFGGGSLENRKYYTAIKRYTSIHEDKLITISLDMSLENKFDGIKVTKNKFRDIVSRLLGHSSYMYFVWQIAKKKVIEYNPDVVIVARTRMGFIARDIKKNIPNCKVICNVENIEYDYADAYFSNNKSILRSIYLMLEKKCIQNDESCAFTYADHVDFLTKRDKIRAKQLYAHNKDSDIVLPICIEHETELRINSKVKNVVFIGTLSYGSNLDALNWFLREVWFPFFFNTKNIRFLIAGNNPAQELKDLVKQIENCILYPNFSNLVEVIPRNSLLIAPIKNGAGMKVKVAESLSMGLIIAASDEALVGYEAVIDNENTGILRSNSVSDYKKAIENYITLDDETVSLIGGKNKQLYKKYYSYNVSYKVISSIIEQIV